MAMVALFVGAAEQMVGTRFAAATFWGSHLAVLVLIALILRPPGLTPPSFAEGLLPLPRDVGPSVGCFACLGLAVVCLRSSVTRSLATAGIVVTLIAALFLPPLAEVVWEVDLLADAGHIAGFVAGWIVGYRYRRASPDRV
jgi:membrane associated rhomboid family serine protease